MRTISTAIALAFMFAAPFALAQTSPPPSEPSAAPDSQKSDGQMPDGKDLGAEKPMTPPAAPAVRPEGSKLSGGPKLSAEEAKAWVDKPIYSSDQNSVGEVVAIDRSATGEVTALQADIGGFLGFGETRVRVDASEFKLMEDRVVLNITADQAKTLPQIETR